MKIFKIIPILILFYFPAIAMSDVVCLKEILNSRKFPSENKSSIDAWKCLDRLAEKIMNGDLNAIDDGVELLRYTDAGYTSSIKTSLGFALEREARHVIRGLRGNESILIYICGLNFIEPDIEFIKKYYKTVRYKIEEIKDEDLIYEKNMCIKNMDVSYKIFLASKNKIIN